MGLQNSPKIVMNGWTDYGMQSQNKYYPFFMLRILVTFPWFSCKSFWSWFPARIAKSRKWSCWNKPRNDEFFLFFGPSFVSPIHKGGFKGVKKNSHLPPIIFIALLLDSYPRPCRFPHHSGWAQHSHWRGPMGKDGAIIKLSHFSFSPSLRQHFESVSFESD